MWEWGVGGGESEENGSQLPLPTPYTPPPPTRYPSTMSRKELFEKVAMEQIIGVVRENSVAAAESVAEAFAANGIRILEVTLTTPEAFGLIKRLAQKPAPLGVVIPAGPPRTANDAARARRAGAKIIVS